jgi:hypothetical protein
MLASLEDPRDPAVNERLRLQEIDAWDEVLIRWSRLEDSDSASPDLLSESLFRVAEAHVGGATARARYTRAMRRPIEETNDALLAARVTAVAARARVWEAAMLVIEVSDARRELAYWAGLPKRAEPPFHREGDVTHVDQLRIPSVIEDAIEARKFVIALPEGALKGDLRMRYASEVGEMYFFYGAFRKAAAPYEMVWRQGCGRHPGAFQAWERLLTMANIENDVARARELAEAEMRSPCAVTAEQRRVSSVIARPVL